MTKIMIPASIVLLLIVLTIFNGHMEAVAKTDEPNAAPTPTPTPAIPAAAGEKTDIVIGAAAAAPGAKTQTDLCAFWDYQCKILLLPVFCQLFQTYCVPITMFFRRFLNSCFFCAEFLSMSTNNFVYKDAKAAAPAVNTDTDLCGIWYYQCVYIHIPPSCKRYIDHCVVHH
ncbi:hypothetical protein A2U01_0000301 [Trifolium medium]|uniref:Prolamin-like domain-containing protein n=1 Tax=Trifolium medium TaxID=97028 RepID=A0A392LX72_9FABA|nr:hypothetical protein [Trifolium medium]